MITCNEITQLLLNILLGCFCLGTLCWIFIGVQSFINDTKREKRDEEREQREIEYHTQRMKQIKD